MKRIWMILGLFSLSVLSYAGSLAGTEWRRVGFVYDGKVMPGYDEAITSCTMYFFESEMLSHSWVKDFGVTDLRHSYRRLNSNTFLVFRENGSFLGKVILSPKSPSGERYLLFDMVGMKELFVLIP